MTRSASEEAALPDDDRLLRLPIAWITMFNPALSKKVSPVLEKLNDLIRSIGENVEPGQGVLPCLRGELSIVVDWRVQSAWEKLRLRKGVVILVTMGRRRMDETRARLAGNMASGKDTEGLGIRRWERRRVDRV